MSRRTRSGGSSPMACIASWPFMARSTSYPSLTRMSFTSSWMKGLSSTTRIRCVILSPLLPFGSAARRLSEGRRAERKLDHEAAAGPVPAVLDAHRAAVAFDDASHDGKAEPAALRPLHLLPGLVVFLENTLPFPGGDAR